MFNINECRNKPSKAIMFTEEEFIKRVAFYWDLMIRKEFEEQYLYNVHFADVESFKSLCRNRTRTLQFSRNLLTGEFKLWFVDDVIKHEIGHALDYFRNGCRHRKKRTKKGLSWDMHGVHFKKISDEFDFDPISNKTDDRLEFMKAYAE